MSNKQGFRKIDPEQWEFANEEFIRGQRHLLKNIYRRKPIHSHSLHNQANPLTDTERVEFEKEIKRLKHDKSLLQLELQRHERENQGFESQLRSLSEQFQSMENRQMKLIAFLAKLVQKPVYASFLMQQSEVHNKKRKMLNSTYLCEGNLDAVSNHMLNSDHIEKLESSLQFWEDTLYEIGEDMDEHIVNTSKLPQACPALATEIQSIEMDTKFYSPISHSSSPNSIDLHSPPQIDGSEYNLGSHCVLPVCFDVEIRPISSEFDMNSKPAGAPELHASKQHTVRMAAVLPSKVNDLFWEQCLTEIPGSSESGRGASGTVNDSKEAINDKKVEHERYR